jgi:hypothetical protein
MHPTGLALCCMMRVLAILILYPVVSAHPTFQDSDPLLFLFLVPAVQVVWWNVLDPRPRTPTWGLCQPQEGRLRIEQAQIVSSCQYKHTFCAAVGCSHNTSSKYSHLVSLDSGEA